MTLLDDMGMQRFDWELRSVAQEIPDLRERAFALLCELEEICARAGSWHEHFLELRKEGAERGNEAAAKRHDAMTGALADYRAFRRARAETDGES